MGVIWFVGGYLLGMLVTFSLTWRYIQQTEKKGLEMKEINEEICILAQQVIDNNSTLEERKVLFEKINTKPTKVFRK